MRTLPCGLLLLMLLVPAARSEAAPIVYDFTVTFDDGLLDGQSFQGTFSLDGDDCTGGICSGLFVPNDPAFTLLSFDITIDGVAFDITDDIGYPDLPGVIVVGGNIELIDYIGSVSG